MQKIKTSDHMLHVLNQPDQVSAGERSDAIRSMMSRRHQLIPLPAA